MKMKLVFLVLMFSTKIFFAQNESLPVGGYFYDGKDLIEKDSELVAQLIQFSQIDVKKRGMISLDKAASLGLLDACDYSVYSLTMDKFAKTLTFRYKEFNRKKNSENKYYSIFCLDSFYNEKIINLYIY